MKLLLDTHVLLWWLAGSERLSIAARTRIADTNNEVYVSAVSAWEVATKVRLGRLGGPAFLALEFGEHVARQGFRKLGITTAHAYRAGSLPRAHGDPFDRMLIAQAQAETLIIVSTEAVFDTYGVQRLW